MATLQTVGSAATFNELLSKMKDRKSVILNMVAYAPYVWKLKHEEYMPLEHQGKPKGTEDRYDCGI